MRGQLSTEARQRGIITRLKKENKKLRIENRFLKNRVLELENQVETLTLQVRELQTIVFGKKNTKFI